MKVWKAVQPDSQQVTTDITNYYKSIVNQYKLDNYFINAPYELIQSTKQQRSKNHLEM